MSRIPSGVPSVANFVEAARPKNPALLPWQKPGVRADVQIQVNVKLSEPLMLAVRHIAYTDGKTQREIIELALQEWMEREAQARGLPPWPRPKA